MIDFFSVDNVFTLFTLTSLEIILGIDNIIFIAILVQTLPKSKRTNIRIIGISLAFILRVIMLFGAAWVIKLTEPIFTIMSFVLSGRNLMLIIGGLFLIAKSILEIIEMFGEETKLITKSEIEKKHWNVIFQIIFVDLILSFDSIITAVGITDNIYIIIIAVVISMIVMLISSKPLSEFINKYPSIKIIALSFVALVGAMLFLNGLNIEFSKAYLYWAMIFSAVVETINIILKKKNKL